MIWYVLWMVLSTYSRKEKEKKKERKIEMFPQNVKHVGRGNFRGYVQECIYKFQSASN